MKNIKLILGGVFALCLILTACSKEEDVVDTTPLPFNLNVEYPVKNAENVAYPESEWNTGSQLVALRTDKLHLDKVIMSWVAGNTF